MVEREPKHRTLDEWGFASLVLGVVLLGIGVASANEAKIENVDLVLKAGVILAVAGGTALLYANRR